MLGTGFGVLFAALAGVLPRLFTPDPAVLAAVPAAWWFFAGMQPLAGVVFALDGVLLGAGDAAYLRTWTLVAAAAGFLPLIWASLAFGWGLVGIWTGLLLFVVLRLVAVLLRVRSGALGGGGGGPRLTLGQLGEDARMEDGSGLVVVDKPAGLTSHDVVARLRRILRTRKVGHAGTLDPMATGVLVCGVGRGTKLLGHLALDTKAYTATIRLGAATTTDDAEGEVVDDGRSVRRRRRGRSPPGSRR